MGRQVLVSNIMMLNEQERFDAVLRDKGYEPIWPQVTQFLSEAECIEMAGGFDGWLAGDDQITEAVLKACLPRLKVISKWGTGVDSIDRQAAANLKIPVCNSPGAFGEAVSEYAFGLLLAATRRIARADRLIREGGWPKGRYPGLSGKTMGIIGFGAIGRGVAVRSLGFGMKTIASDPFVTESKDGTELMPLKALMRQADVICLCCNLTPENYHLLDEAMLALTKPGVIIVNVARGGLIDEPALLSFLASGHVGAAALDVFEEEPVPQDCPFFAFENVVVSSHNANSTLEAIEAVHNNTLENLFQHLS